MGFFQHPYFDSFKQECNEILSNKSVAASALHIFNNNQMNQDGISARGENLSNNPSELKLKKIANSSNISGNNNNVLTAMPNVTNVSEVMTKEAKFDTHRPVINNTTNINIINYNYDNEETAKKRKNPDVKKSSDNDIILKKSNNNMVLTTLNFPKNYKENLLTMYGGTNFDSNFKTFYKNDKYNYEIDLNFKNQKKPKLLSIDEEEDNETKKKSKSFPKQVKHHTNRVKNVELGVEDYNKLAYKTKSKNVGTVYQSQQKISPGKYPSYNNTKASINGVNNFPTGFNYNLPNITLKNFKIKNK